jgi:hypothetical protein
MDATNENVASNDGGGAEVTSPPATSTAAAPPPPSPFGDKKIKPRDPRGAIQIYHEKEHFLTKKVLFCLDLSNPMRKGALWLVTWRWFDWFIMTIILANAIFMGLADYSVVDETGNPYPTDFRTGERSQMNQIIEGLDPTFTGIYCVEAVIKIIALGFVSGPNTYLRDGWNVLDFVAAVSSVVAFIPDVPNVSSLRTLRVLRPLRSLKMLPGMKVIIDSILMAIEPLANVVVLLIAVFVIFGILMTQLFMGVQHQRCRTTPFPIKLEVSLFTHFWLLASGFWLLASGIDIGIGIICCLGSSTFFVFVFGCFIVSLLSTFSHLSFLLYFPSPSSSFALPHIFPLIFRSSQLPHTNKKIKQKSRILPS